MLDAFIIDEIQRRERAERGIAPHVERPNRTPPRPPIAPRRTPGDGSESESGGGDDLDRSEDGRYESPLSWDHDRTAPTRGVVILGEDVEASDGRTVIDM